MSAEPAFPPDPQNASPVVMLVEDDTGVRSLLSRVLETAGFGLASFAAPAEALDAAARIPRIDVLVTDIGLPGIPGTELAGQVRSMHPEVQVLFMSGLNAPDGLCDGLLDVEARFLQKPFRPSEFVARVIHLSARERPDTVDRIVPGAA